MRFYAGVIHEVAEGVIAFGFVDGTKDYVFFAVGVFVVIEDVGVAAVLELKLLFSLGVKVNIIFGHNLFYTILDTFFYL